MILRLTGLALAYGIFTLTIETSKRPIRAFVASSSPIDSFVGLWNLASSIWCSAEPGKDTCLAPSAQPPAGPSSSGAPAVHRVQSAASRSVAAPRKESRVAVEDLCESCYDGWVRAGELRALLSAINCEDELFQPCRLCSEREEGLFHLERTLQQHNSPQSSRLSLYATA